MKHIGPSASGHRGIEWEVPDGKERRETRRIICDELSLGEFRVESRELYLGIIARMKEEECDAAALVCTEIPLPVTPDISPLPLLDSTRLLAVAAVEAALGEREMPVRRGGLFAVEA
ncbi:MAG: hypothetical protein ACFBQW_05985 [Sphingomonadaceae bacterium]